MTSTANTRIISQSDYGNVNQSAFSELNTARELLDTPVLTRNTLEIQGSLFKVKRTKFKKYKNKKPSKRGTIKKFSNKSRARLIEKMLRLDWDTISEIYQARFITLTTTPEFWGASGVLYDKLDNMRRWLFSNGAKQAYIKREYGEKNGAHHFHLMVFWEKGMAPEPECKNQRGGTFQKYWSRALGVEDIRIEVAIPHCWNDCKEYITKYCTKTAYDGKGFDTCEYLERVSEGMAIENEREQRLVNKFHNAEKKGFHNGRRFWYVWGEGNLPEAELTETDLSYTDLRDLWKIRRIYRGVVRAREKKRRIIKYCESKHIPIREYKGRKGKYKLYKLDKKEEKQALKGLTSSRNIRYYARGSFNGWRIWLNGMDSRLMQYLIGHLTGVNEYASFTAWSHQVRFSRERREAG